MIGACSDPEYRNGRETACSSASGTEAERLALTQSSSRSTVALFGTNPEGSATFICSGVLVGARTVLTAGHCLLDRDSWSLEVVLDADARVGRATRQVVERKRHPSRDLAAVTLDTDADAPPLRWSESMLGGMHANGMTVQGFGGPEDTVGRCLRVAETVSDLGYDPFAPPSTWVNAVLAGEVCKGDSGGPLLVNLSGESIVLGIVSLGAVRESTDCGSLIKLERLLTSDPWVTETLRTEPVRIPCPEKLHSVPGCTP